MLVWTVEKFAIRCALGNNGGEWATHYTEEQKEFWRSFVTDLVRAMCDEYAEWDIVLPHDFKGSMDDYMKAAAAGQVSSITRVRRGG